MNRILILGTGRAQEDIIQYCKARGMRVFACSYTSGDVGEPYADEFAQLDICDTAAVEKYAAVERVHYVYSAGSDIAMPTVAKVSEALDLPHFVSAQTATICNTKSLLRTALGTDFEGNLRFQEMMSPEEKNTIGFPAVMKPVDSQGQRGIYKVCNKEELSARFDSAVQYSKKKKVIVEEFVDGDEISVNTFSVDGKLVFYLISDRITWDEYPLGLIHEHVIPSRYAADSTVADRILKLVKDVLNKLKITDGPAYFQIKIDRNGAAKLVEVTPRLDGCHLWKLIAYATGYNLLEQSISLLTGEMVHEYVDQGIRPCRLTFLCEEPGRLFDRSKYNLSDAKYIKWYYQNGETVKKMNGYIEKGGYKITEE